MNVKELYKIGDLVKLKSGSPELTVDSLTYIDIPGTKGKVYTGFVICKWFDVEEDLCEEEFNQDSLIKVLTSK